MVKLVEVEDNESVYSEDSQYTTDDEALTSEEEEEEDGSDFEDDDDYLDESFLERLTALKDIIPAHHRQSVINTTSTLYQWSRLGGMLAGKLTWIFTTSALLVVFPLALETDRDKMMQQWQDEQQQGSPEQKPTAPPPGAQMPGMGSGMPGLAPGVVQ